MELLEILDVEAGLPQGANGIQVIDARQLPHG